MRFVCDTVSGTPAPYVRLRFVCVCEKHTCIKWCLPSHDMPQWLFHQPRILRCPRVHWPLLAAPCQVRVPALPSMRRRHRASRCGPVWPPTAQQEVWRAPMCGNSETSTIFSMWSQSGPTKPTLSHSLTQRKRWAMSNNIFWRCCHQRSDQLHLLGVADSVAETSHFDILDETLHLTASVCSLYSSKRVSTHLELDGFLASSVLVNLVRISIEHLHSVFKSPVFPIDPLCTHPAHPTLHRGLVYRLAGCLRTVEPHARWCQNSSTKSGEESGETCLE